MSTNLDFGAAPIINRIVDDGDEDVVSAASENVAENWEDLLEDDEASLANAPKPQTESEKQKLKMNEIIEKEDMKASADLFSNTNTKDEKKVVESPAYEFVDEFTAKLESYKNNLSDLDNLCHKLFAGLLSAYSVQSHKRIEKIFQTELSSALRRSQKSGNQVKKSSAPSTKTLAAQSPKPAQKKSLNTGASRKKNTKGWDMDLPEDDQDDYYDDN